MTNEDSPLFAKSSVLNEDAEISRGVIVVAQDEMFDADKRPRNCLCPPLLANTPQSVYMILLNSVLVGTTVMMTNTIWVLYLNAQGWTSATNITFYAVVTALGVFLPVILNPAIGWIQEYRPTKEILIIESLITATGFTLMAAVANQWVFLVGYILSSTQAGMRSVRVSYVSSRTPHSVRTRAVSAVSIGFLVGALVGPLLALLCSLAPDPQESWHLGALEINRCTLVIWLAVILMLLKLVASIIFREIPELSQTEAMHGRSTDNLHNKHEVLADEGSVNERGKAARWSGYIRVPRSDGTEKTVHTTSVVTKATLVIYIMIFLIAMSSGCYIVAAGPILVNHFKYTQFGLSIIIFSIAAIGAFPIVLGAILSKYLKDRTLILGACIVVIIGYLFFSVPPVQEWQMFVGLLLMMPPSSVIFSTTSSLFSKLLAARAPGLLMGLMMAISALGSSIGNLIGGLFLLDLYDKQLYSIFILPVLIGATMILVFHRTLDPMQPVYQITNADYPPDSLSQSRPQVVLP